MLGLTAKSKRFLRYKNYGVIRPLAHSEDFPVPQRPESSYNFDIYRNARYYNNKNVHKSNRKYYKNVAEAKVSSR
jgi:hypothetical protein